MCSTKSLLAGDGEIIAQIYKERRVITRGYGSGARGWMTAYPARGSPCEPAAQPRGPRWIADRHAEEL